MSNNNELSEKEKAISGLPYYALGEELTADRLHAKEVLYDFNIILRPKQLNERNDIIKKLFGSTKDKFYIEPPFHCDYGYNIDIGNNFYSNYNLIILDCAKVTIGNNVFFGPNVSIYTAGHPIHYEPRNKDIEYAFPITIGDNVWIGGNVVINPNVTIGSNTVIGSGSVITKNIPDNVVAVGNPCRIVRTIVDADKEYYFRDYKI
jgi:acetyltransferase-like isoleucine patch superfamily enzyme